MSDDLIEADPFWDWFSDTCRDPDGSLDHIPGWLEDELRRAWNAGESHALAAKDTAISEMRAERDGARELAQMFSQASRKVEWIARATAAEAELERVKKALEMLEAYCSGGFDDGRPPPNRKDAICAARDALAARALFQDEPAG